MLRAIGVSVGLVCSVVAIGAVIYGAQLPFHEVLILAVGIAIGAGGILLTYGD